MKKLLSLALACTLTLGLASCGGTGTSTSSNAPASSSAVESPAAQFDAASYLSGDYPKLPEDGPAYSLSIGHAMQESTESHKMLLALKDAVEKYSDGKITITIYPNSQLGSDSEMIASCVAETWIWFFSVDLLTPLSFLKLLFLTFHFSSQDTIAKKLRASLQPASSATCTIRQTKTADWCA